MKLGGNLMKPVKNTIDIEREERDKNRCDPTSYIRPFWGYARPGGYWDGVTNNSNYQTTSANSTAYGQTTPGGR